MSNPLVLIVGAGPTGLTLACELARRNVSFRIIDRMAEYPTGSRAKGVQPRSIEVFDDLGIADEMIEAGTIGLPFRRFKGPDLLGDMPRQAFQREDTRYVQGLVMPQWKVEEILRGRLAEFGATVEMGTELVSFSQTDAGVTAVLKAGDETEEVECDYMIGCDGGKSNVRKSLGIKFEGETHEEEKVLVGDVEVEGLTPNAWHIWVHETYGFIVALCPFNGTASWQIQTLAAPDADGNIPEPNLENFNRLFAERTGMPDVKLKNLTWGSIYRVNVRMADKYRVGRVFIAGDAAHAHSIAGGLGMNTGIQDAYNLGWKLADVLNGDKDEALLDTYEEERLPIAAWTLNISSERQKAITDKGDGKAGFENLATRDTTQLNLNYRYSSLSIENGPDEEGRLRAGDRAPDAVLSDGRRLFDLYRGTHFTVVALGEGSEEFDGASGKNMRFYRLNDEKAFAAFGTRDAVYVIRPDGYIGMVEKKGDDVKI